ncbi:hypothetical protein GGS23DRAFT_485583 [Durotheca rogersii]|uniref:uncharacterized protein n=1 Tax=Durotheca rogersii TaxID=419775 RepID=UPI00221FE695|nr:uncharacterized protein GGS23DRAFT_485583 [Durotheca rogersii]KAI5864172.1 hypothetical protein GGS23DRAFT_485583 [Durotheca rogersii]
MQLCYTHIGICRYAHLRKAPPPRRSRSLGAQWQSSQAACGSKQQVACAATAPTYRRWGRGRIRERDGPMAGRWEEGGEGSPPILPSYHPARQNILDPGQPTHATHARVRDERSKEKDKNSRRRMMLARSRPGYGVVRQHTYSPARLASLRASSLSLSLSRLASSARSRTAAQTKRGKRIKGKTKEPRDKTTLRTPPTPPFPFRTPPSHREPSICVYAGLPAYLPIQVCRPRNAGSSALPCVRHT